MLPSAQLSSSKSYHLTPEGLELRFTDLRVTSHGYCLYTGPMEHKSTGEMGDKLVTSVCHAWMQRVLLYEYYTELHRTLNFPICVGY